ncbi:sensor histidine kinase YesM [Chryseobacterium defluvii]|uniref:Sensor histidine kinase YesM n=1 Tax=Chryseobacterium defluvii TaxID=160396 RepID=A0A840KJB0_9FLAO|nr:hypothetical protein [Chryseobacterium defluvii]MBB4807590.1 sensor histidine kinase YesM [Chryseobacterium defluvii]
MKKLDEKDLNKKKILDSLLFKVLPKIQESDIKKKIETYEIAENYLSDKLGNYATYILRGKAAIYEDTGEPEKALYYIDKSYEAAIEFQDFIGAARSLQHKGIYYGKRNDLLKSEIYIKQSIDLVEKNLYNPIVDSVKNKNLLLNLKSNLCINYSFQKKYAQSIDLLFSTLKLAKNLKNKKTEAIQYGYIGKTYTELNQNKKALEYYFLENKIAIEINEKKTEAYSYVHIAQTLRKLNLHNNIENYLNKALNIFNDIKDADGILKTKNAFFTYYRLNKKYDKCIEMVSELEGLYKKDKQDLSHFYIELGEVYTHLKAFSKAESYFNMAEKILDEKRSSKRFLYKKKVLLEEAKGNMGKALEYKNNEIEVSKKELDTVFADKIVSYETRYKTAEKESKIKSQQLQLEREKTTRNIAISGAGFLLLLSSGGFWFIKNRQKQKELQTQNTLLGLQQNLNAMELQSLNRQLDPHEIKNLLANISPEIQEKAPDSYSKMIKLFNITKASLNNTSLTDSIENQIRQIKDLLSLEQNMLFVPLEYSIENKIENIQLQIPRLMLKNLVENSIKHGIKEKESGGRIIISLFEKENYINIWVDDSGKGRKSISPSYSGIGTSTYQKLFATLNHKNKENASFDIIDKEEGTRVEVKIPLNYKYS